MTAARGHVRWFEDIGAADEAEVGGKNSSLGELIRALKGRGIVVPDGFAVTAEAYRLFVESNGLAACIRSSMEELRSGKAALQEAGGGIRDAFARAEFPDQVAEELRRAYGDLSGRFGTDVLSVAVRSSATAEDLPGASFAGQQETFLNVVGEQHLLDACRRCYASLFTDRAISYREEMGFDHLETALSLGVQKMVRSDKAGSGVMFTLDPETGFRNVVVVSAAWGLGEAVAQGSVSPDEYVVFKPLLGRQGVKPILDKRLGDKQIKSIYDTGGVRGTRTVETSMLERRSFVLRDDEILQLARWGCDIEDHYGRPMDVEWAKDGDTGSIFVVQARPETVQAHREASFAKTYTLKERGEVLLRGLSIGEAIAAGRACVIESPAGMGRFETGSILVAEMTDPDWVPIMKRAAGIVTDHGGRTSHAAIVSREMGIPAVIGTGEATDVLRDGQEITLSCAEGSTGYVYDGILGYFQESVRVGSVPQTRTQIMINMASPEAAFRWWWLPCKGIGLARMEFIINDVIKVHPMALARFQDVTDPDAARAIERLTRGYDDKVEYFVDKLARGVGKIAASQYPHMVLVRLSDFKSNEYANLIGGRQFEPREENPMLGFRGASRYYSDAYRDGFALECRGLRRVREEMGLSNVAVMVPFCRTPDEARRVLEVMAENGLRKGEDGLQVYVMCEVPSNVVLADRFAELFDGFSIGSNDLTQLVLGVDRDSPALVHLFDERNEAVARMIVDLIKVAHSKGAKVGICGQAPSDYPEFAEFLVSAGIDSISLNPDSVISVMMRVAKAESGRREESATLPSRLR